MANVTSELELALEDQRRGRHELAARRCRRMLARSPEDAEAWHLLGLAEQAAGRIEAAVEHLERACGQSDGHPLVRFNLAQALGAAGRWDEAVTALEHVTAVRPEWSVAERALGSAWLNVGRGDRAEAAWRRALELDPEDAATAFCLGALKRQQGAPVEARAWLERSCRARPEHAKSWNNLGALLLEQGELEEAATALRRALEADRRMTEAAINLALVLKRLRRPAEAIEVLEALVRERPDEPEALALLAGLEAGTGRTEKAAQRRGALARRAPRDLVAQLQAASIAPVVPESVEEIVAWQRRLTDRLEALQDEPLEATTERLDVVDLKPPTQLLYDGTDNRRVRRLHARLIERALGTREPEYGAGRPRVGFVATPGNEGIFQRGMTGLLRRLVSPELEIVVACGADAAAGMRTAIGDERVEVIPIEPRASRAAATLRAARLDALWHWEIGSDSLNYLLPALRCAPLQVTSWGWPDTAGWEAVTGFISSGWIESKRADEHYEERLVRLDCFPHWYDRKTLDGAVAGQGSVARRAGERLYACLQNPRKIHPDFEALLAAILRSDGEGRVVLLEARNPAVTEALRRRFAGRFGDVASRCEFLPRRTRGAYLALAAEADVLLDTVHYTGGANTAADALALGRAVVTLPGVLHRARYTMGVYRSIGVPEAVARTPAEYVSLAAELARDAERRRALEARVRERRDAFFADRRAVCAVHDLLVRWITAGREGARP